MRQVIHCESPSMNSRPTISQNIAGIYGLRYTESPHISVGNGKDNLSRKFQNGLSINTPPLYAKPTTETNTTTHKIPSMFDFGSPVKSSPFRAAKKVSKAPATKAMPSAPLLADNEQTPECIWHDERLMKSSIFAKRINTAATKIQAMMRGVLGRKYSKDIALHWSATYIQSIFRSFLAFKELRKLKAVVSIQKIYRGRFSRMQTRILFLERSMERIEEAKQRELFEIKQWRKQQLGSLEEELYSVVYESKQQAKTYRKQQKKIKKLQESNKQLRQENEELSEAIEDLYYENIDLERFINLEVLKANEINKRMIALDQENKQFEWCIEQMAERAQEYKDAIENRDNAIEFEGKISKMIRDTIYQVIVYADKSSETDIVDELLELTEDLDL